MEKTTAFLRQALPEEVPLLTAIELEAATRFPEDILPEPMRSGHTVPGEIMAEAVEKGRLWVAAGGDDIPLGYAVWRDIEGLALLAQVDVLPAHGQRGIGRFLVRRVMEQVCETGYRFLYLTTFKNIPWNAPFYAKLGFMIVPDDDLPGPMPEIIKQERTLIQNRVAMRCDLPDSLSQKLK